MKVRRLAMGPLLHRVLSGVLTMLLIALIAGATVLAGKPAVIWAQSAPFGTAVAVPDNALAYFAVTADQSSSQWQLATTLVEVAGLSSLIDEALEDASSDGTSEDGLADLEPFLGGEIGFVVTSLAAARSVDVTGLTGGLAPATDTGAASEPVGFALIAQAADPAAAFAKAQELSEEEASEIGAVSQTTEYNGVPILSYPGDESNDGSAIAQVGDLLLVSGTPADLEPLIDTAAGTTPSITTAPDFAMLQAELNQEFLLFGYINGPAIGTALEGSEELGALGSITMGSIPFIDSSTSMVIWADEPGFRLDTVSTSPAGSTTPVAENFDGTLDERVPGDTLFFIDGMDLGASGVLDALALLFVQEFNDEGAGSTPPAGTDPEVYMDQQFEQAATQLGFNIKTDLIDQLVGEFGFALSLGDFLLDPNSASALFVSGVENGAIVADTLSKIALLIASGVAGDDSTTTVTTRDLDGSVIHVIEDMSSGFPIRVELGVVADQLLIGLGTALDAFVGGATADALADNPQYQAVMGALPADHAAAMYLDMARLIEVVMGFTDSMGGNAEPVLDADLACGDYATQEDAQAAYDADAFALSNLDQNFDGIACEDFFSPAAAGSPEVELDFSAIRALATVITSGEGVVGSNTILYIEEQ
ncbi:MAG: DUF3352 domain-containing protein [Chloroflexota bacterium]|nr:DUF3352 domain-containing protein [Chloroflexota bacterium]